MEIAILAVLGAVAGGLVVWQRYATEGSVSPWQALAEGCGLTEIRPASRFSRDLTGRSGSLEVRLGPVRSTQTQTSTLLTVRGLARFIALRPESFGSWLDKTVRGGEIRIGDEPFDRAFYLQGDEPLFRALLDAETRRLLSEALSGLVGPKDLREEATVVVYNGDLQAQFADDVNKGRLPRSEAIRWLIDVARRLEEPSDLLGRLVENAEHEPLAAMRRLTLQTLERIAPTEPATRAAMQHAAQADVAAEVRLHAALWLGRDGWSVLEELAADGRLEDSVSARAIEGLGDQMAFDRASRILDESLVASRVQTARAAVKALAGGGDATVPILAAAIERAPAVAAAAAAALGHTRSPLAEAPLIAALGAAPLELRSAAAEALGSVGTVSSVPALRELAQRSRGRVRDASLGAIARIRARLTGADPGRLALADGSEGHLEFANDEQGRVALPDPGEPSESS